MSSRGIKVHTGGNRIKDMSPIEAQNCMRLRVNRITLVQDLDVDDLMDYLRVEGVLSKNDETLIDGGTTSQDKTRRLIDILPTKDKSTEWYRHFRDSIRITKKYQRLVDFLDNTIIDKPEILNVGTATKVYPRYSPLPDIVSSSSTSSEASTQGHSVAFDVTSPADREDIDEGNKSEIPKMEREQTFVITDDNTSTYLYAPENFKSLIEVDQARFKRLSKSDEEMYNQEQSVLNKMKHLEVAFAIHKRHQLPEGAALCMTKAVHDVLFDLESHHLYFKYFHFFKLSHRMDMTLDITGSFGKVIGCLDDPNNPETCQFMTKIGFHLVDFLKEFGDFTRAELTISALIRYLATIGGTEALMPLFEVYVRAMSLRNSNFHFHSSDSDPENCNFDSSDYALNKAQQFGDKIQLVSFGKDLLDCSEFFVEKSIMMREMGSLGPAYAWAQKALEEVDPTHPHTIVNVLCNATLAYTAMWKCKRAEKLALQAMKQARSTFGVNHPLYVKALHHYVIYSNEFRRDEFGVAVAREALETAEKIYGDISTVQIALSHKLLSEALMAATQYGNGAEYHREALCALRMIVDCVPGNHPKVSACRSGYRVTLANCWLVKGEIGPQEVKMASYTMASSELEAALSDYFGDISIRACQLMAMYGIVMGRLKVHDKAQQSLENAVTRLELCTTSATKRILYQTHAMLGTYLLQKVTSIGTIGEHEEPDEEAIVREAIVQLKKAVDHVRTPDIFIPWIDEAYDTLTTALKAICDSSEAMKYTRTYLEWKKDNIMPPILNRWEDIHQEPEKWEKFMEHFLLQMKRANKLKEGMKKVAIAHVSSIAEEKSD